MNFTPSLFNNDAEIVIVDDVIENLHLLITLLSNQGYKVRPSNSGRVALESIKRRKPELILLDIQMPEMSGYELCRRLQASEETCDIPIIFITASGDPDGAVKGLELGAVDYIVKPFHEEEVLARVKTHLENYRMRRYLAMESMRKEAKYQRIVEGLKDEYFFYSRKVQGELNFLSPSVKEILGYESHHFLAHIGDFLTDHKINETVKEEIALGLSGQHGPSYEIEVFHKNGHKVRLNIKETPVKDAQGNLISFEGIAHDITNERKQQQKLHHNLQKTVQAIALTIEQRDPYTAGHQKRVADLASAIAEMLNCDQNQIFGISLGAMIHDIGKVHIPAEILSKPGKLNAVEYELIKMHPKTGGNIIEHIDFEWPVKEIIQQHHERLDGSGYPLGLKADEIAFEAKIVAVADVVEAMSSHRPYRAGLGIETALDDIRLGSGTLYDAQVVEACIRLFQEHHYQFINEETDEFFHSVKA